MKKMLFAFVALLLLPAASSHAEISGSRHDMRLYGGRLSSCIYCHGPHHVGTQEVPLWNRNAPATVYTVYGGTGSSGATLSGTSIGQPGSFSLACLSCHDGTIGVGDLVFGKESGGYDGIVLDAATGKLIRPKANFGSDLRREHPIGITYSSGAVSAGLTNVGITPIASSTNYVVNNTWRLYGGGNNTGKIECGSCHDPHGNDSTTSGTTSTWPFLRGSRSIICTDCHANK